VTLLPRALLPALIAGAVASGAAPAAPVRDAPAVAAPAPGLAFALAMKGDGQPLASGPYLLKVPGGSGPLRLELSRLAADGARLRGEARLVNGSGLLLAGLALDFASASPAPADPAGTSAVSTVALSLREPLAFGELLPGESTGYLPFELSPVPLGEAVSLTTLLGAVSGLAVEPPAAVEGATHPVALDSDRSGRLYVATAGVGRVLRFVPALPSAPGEAARPSAPPAGVALRRRTGDLFVSTGGPAIEVHRAGRRRPALLQAGRAVAALRADAKGTLRAASGNGVLAFEEAKAGPLRPLGPEGAEVLSFDTDPKGLLHAVVREAGSRRLVVDAPGGPRRFAAEGGPGADALDAPSACRFDGEGTLWVAAAGATPRSSVLARFAGAAPVAALPRLALALLLGRDEDAAVPAIVDLAPGPERRVYVLLDTGAVFAARPF